MSKILILLALLAQDAPRPRSAFADLPADGTLAVAGQAVPWKDLAAALKRHAESGIRQIVLRVDGAVPFSNVQTLMAAAREAGLEGVQFSAEKPVAPVRFSPEARRSIRIKLREGAQGLELLVLQESTAVSLDDLRRKLKAIEKGPIVLDADVVVPYAAVQQIVSACTEEGFDKVSFAGSARKTGAIRVLYAEQVPRYEFRYLRNMLERSAEVTLDVTLATADRDFPGARPSFPSDLSAYDVVLMGGLRQLEADSGKALQEFVNRGGGLVWIAPEELPGPGWLGHQLESVCPVRLTGRQRAAAGERKLIVREPASPLIEGLPWDGIASRVREEWTIEKLAKDARVAVESRWGEKSQGFLVLLPCGKGRALYVGNASTWTWREGTGDRPLYAPFWTNVLKWAAGR